MKNFSSQDEINIENETSVNIKNKMAAKMSRKNILLKLEKDVTVTFSVLLSLQLQFYGFLIPYEMFEMRRNNMLLIYLTNKKDEVNRKRKYLLSRKLGRKKRSTWVQFEERTEVGGRKCYLMTFLKIFGKKALE